MYYRRFRLRIQQKCICPLQCVDFHFAATMIWSVVGMADDGSDKKKKKKKKSKKKRKSRPNKPFSF